MTETAEDLPVMPDFVRPVRLGRHVLDSALADLRERGIPDDRVRIRPITTGGEHGTVVAQSPAAGKPIDPREGVVLDVESTGLMDRLPFALRSEPLDEFGTDQVLGLFDSSAAHTGHYLRLGGDLFVLRDGDDRGARRWLEEIFAIDPARFDRARWHAVARFAARLHAVAGRPDAAVTALQAVYGIRARATALHPAGTSSASEGRWALGQRGGRLGLSTILGSEPVTPRRLVVQIGPVPLSQFEEHRTIAMRRERVELYKLCLPFWIDPNVTETWRVIGPEDGMRLGDRGAVAPRLGWTSYLADGGQRHEMENALG